MKKWKNQTHTIIPSASSLIFNIILVSICWQLLGFGCSSSVMKIHSVKAFAHCPWDNLKATEGLEFAKQKVSDLCTVCPTASSNSAFWLYMACYFKVELVFFPIFIAQVILYCMWYHAWIYQAPESGLFFHRICRCSLNAEARFQTHVAMKVIRTFKTNDLDWRVYTFGNLIWNLKYSWAVCVELIVY